MHVTLHAWRCPPCLSVGMMKDEAHAPAGLMGLVEAATAGIAQAAQQSGPAGQAMPTLEETQEADLLLAFADASAEQQQQPQPVAAAAQPPGSPPVWAQPALQAQTADLSQRRQQARCLRWWIDQRTPQLQPAGWMPHKQQLLLSPTWLLLLLTRSPSTKSTPPRGRQPPQPL